LVMQTLLDMLQHNHKPSTEVTTALAAVLKDEALDDALKAEALLLPTEADIAEQCNPVNPPHIHHVRVQLRQFIATSLQDDLLEAYQQRIAATGLTDQAMQQRKLKNVCLSYLGSLKEQTSITLIYQQFTDATNMTDQYAALAILADIDCEERNLALASFEKQWADEPNVMDKWFSVQAASSLPNTLKLVEMLMQHDKFDKRNPNKVRAVIGSFAMRNPTAFHAEDASGYAFVAEQIIALDNLNPQIASRLSRALMNWKRYEPKLGRLMNAQLQRIADTKDISGDVFEIVSKSLTL